MSGVNQFRMRYGEHSNTFVDAATSKMPLAASWTPRGSPEALPDYYHRARQDASRNITGPHIYQEPMGAVWQAMPGGHLPGSHLLLRQVGDFFGGGGKEVEPNFLQLIVNQPLWAATWGICLPIGIPDKTDGVIVQIADISALNLMARHHGLRIGFAASVGEKYADMKLVRSLYDGHWLIATHGIYGLHDILHAYGWSLLPSALQLMMIFRAHYFCNLIDFLRLDERDLPYAILKQVQQFVDRADATTGNLYLELERKPNSHCVAPEILTGFPAVAHPTPKNYWFLSNADLAHQLIHPEKSHYAIDQGLTSSVSRFIEQNSDPHNHWVHHQALGRGLLEDKNYESLTLEIRERFQYGFGPHLRAAAL